MVPDAHRTFRIVSLLGALLTSACGDGDRESPTRDAGSSREPSSETSNDDDEDDDAESTPSRDGGSPTSSADREDAATPSAPRDASASPMRDAGAAPDAGEPVGDASLDEDSGTASDAASTRPSANSLALPTIMEKPNVEPWFNIYRPMDLSATGEPLPVVVWANGGCFREESPWRPLFEKWASGGFVVLALSPSPGPLGLLNQSTVDHHAKLVEWAIAEANKADSPYAGKLDTKRIVAAGNSCGGVTALGAAAKDQRVAAVFVLSGSSAVGSTDKNVMSKIKVPIGYISGEIKEDIAAPNAAMDYEAIAEGIPAMMINRNKGDHVTISTDAALLAKSAEIALNWLDLALYGNAEAYAAITAPKLCSKCDPGEWTLKSKSLEKLKR